MLAEAATLVLFISDAEAVFAVRPRPLLGSVLDPGLLAHTCRQRQPYMILHVTASANVDASLLCRRYLSDVCVF